MERPTAQQFEAIQAVFLEACELPREEQTACVRKRLAGQAQLIDSVMRLLAADARGQGLGDPACVPAFSDGEGAAMQGHLPAGTLIGNWRIERLLAHGGMSAVYLASRQTSSFRQQVALKIIAADADPQRFTAERRILAGLEHPGIARLIDGGVHADGRPWLATEYIEGVRIDRFPGTHKNKLKLLIEVAEAVAYAHAHLVIHRDIKPANVLVTPDGHAKLLDFGIAKLIESDATRATRTGTSIMTPQHAAPEQILGRPVTVQTDVHAMGVLACEVLTGRHPFADEGTPIIAITRAIVDRQAPAPSSLCADMQARRQLRGNLDAIISKALRKRADQRYTSAASMAEDLRRMLTGEAVEARRGNRWYRLRSAVYHHRLAAVVTLGVLAVLGTTLALRLHQLASERDRATAVSGFLGGLITDLDPTERNVADARHLRVRDVLDAGRSRLRDSRLQAAIRAQLLTRLADDYNSLFLAGEAEKTAREALDIARHDAIPQAIRFDAAIALADALTAQQRLDEAESLLVDMENHQVTTPGQRGRVNLGLGQVLIAAGQPRAAEKHLADASTNLRGTDAIRSRIVALSLMARTQDTLGKHGEALASARRAYLLNLAKLPEAHVILARTRAQYAQILEETDPAAAEPLLRQAMRSLQTILGQGNKDVLAIQNNYGLLLWKLRRYDEAETRLRAVLEQREKRPDADLGENGKSWQNLAALLCQRQRLDACLEAAQHAQADLDQALPANHYLHAFPLLTMAGVQLAKHDTKAARKGLRRARTLLASLPATTLPRMMVRARLAIADAVDGRCDDALPVLARLFAGLGQANRVRFQKEFSGAFVQCQHAIPDVMMTSSAASSSALTPPGLASR